MFDQTTQPFRKSSTCESGTCVEVSIGEEIMVRNSTEPSTVVKFTKEEWRAFLAGVRIGDFEAD